MSSTRRTSFHGDRPLRVIVTSSKALVPSSDALVTSSFLLLVVRHLLLVANIVSNF